MPRARGRDADRRQPEIHHRQRTRRADRAVVLFTDGGNNAGSDYKIAATAAADSLIPIYTVGLGSDKRPPNLRIVDLEAPERVYPGDKFTLTGYVQAQNYKNGGVTVELLSAAADGGGDTKEDEQTLDVAARARSCRSSSS